MDNLIERLREGYWSGDTHDDLADGDKVIFEAATNALMTEAAAEMEALRVEVRDAYAAADSKAGWEWKKRAEAAESRAEKMEQALKLLEQYLAGIECSDSISDAIIVGECFNIVETALKQEDK